MANDKITMLKLKRMLQLLSCGQSLNFICSELHMSKRTVHNYKQLVSQTNLTYDDLIRLSDFELTAILQPASSVPQADGRKSTLDLQLEGYLSELNRPYVTIQLLWEEYIAQYPDGYQYTQFKKYLTDYRKHHEYVYHNTYAPGQEWQIDFAGDHLYLTDRKSGSSQAVVLLCCILPFSGYAFAIALMSAVMEHFFYGLGKGLEYLGAVPQVAKSDNMTQWVKKSSRYEPRFTDATDQWCLHYGIMPDVCRVRKPRDKGPVEGLVNKLYQFIYARMRNEVFYTLDSLNSRILELLDEFNCKDIKRKGISRRDIYMREEKPLMNVLPLTPYRFRYQKEFTVSSNYHVLVGSEQHSYSIPYQYVGKPAKVLWDMDTVEVYVAAERIVIHKRNFAAYGYTTLENHMPANHVAYKRTKEYNAAAIQARALHIGQATKWAVDSLLASRNFPQQSYRTCQGIFSLASRYGERRIESACSIIRSGSSGFTLTMLRNILQKNLDQNQTETISTTPINTQVRGAQEYNQINNKER